GIEHDGTRLQRRRERNLPRAFLPDRVALRIEMKGRAAPRIRIRDAGAEMLAGEAGPACGAVVERETSARGAQSPQSGQASLRHQRIAGGGVIAIEPDEQDAARAHQESL